MGTITLDITDPPATEEDIARIEYLTSEAGSWYAVLSVRKVNSTANPNRWRFRTQRIAKPHHAPHWRTLRFHWYPRTKDRAGGRQLI